MAGTTALLGALLSYWYLILPIIYILRCIQLRYFHKFSHIPGPFLASCTDLYAAHVFLTGHQEEIERELHRKYGPVVRIKPEHVLVSDYRMLPVIFHMKAHKTNYQDMSGIGLAGSVFGALRSEEHTLLKKRVNAAYSMTNVRRMESIMDERILEFIEKVDENSQKGPFDFAPWSMYLAYDVVSDLAFGKAFGFVRTGKDVFGLIKGFHEALPVVGVMQRLRSVSDFITGLPGIKGALVIAPEDKSGIGAVMGFRDKLLEERIKSGNIYGRNDMLQYFLDRTKAEDPAMQIPHDHIRAECLSLMLAGSDTVSTIIRSVLRLLSEHPQIYSTLEFEIDKAQAAGKLSSPMSTYEDCLALPFLQATLKETLRLTHAVPQFLIRPLDEPLEINGIHLPAGSHVAMNPWVVSRSEELYGKDVDEFVPERWLKGNTDIEKYDFSFGYGARVCIGKNIALVELNKVVVELVRRFKVVRCEPPKEGGYPYSIKNEGVWIEKGLWMQFIRKDSSKLDEKKESLLD